MADIGPIFWGAIGVGNPMAALSFANFALNAANDGLYFIFRAPNDGPVITKAAFRHGTLTGSSPTYVVSLQGVDTATGLADGTIKSGSGSNDVFVEITPDGAVTNLVQEYTFGGGGYNSAPGEYLALCIEPKGGTTIDGSNTWGFTAYTGAAQAIGFPYYVSKDAGTPTKQTRVPVFALSDGTKWWGSPHGPIQGVTYVTTGSSPAQSGCYFTVPAGVADTVTCVGIWLCMYGAYNHTLSLYDAADSLLAQVVADPDITSSVGTAYWHYCLFDDAAVELTCGSYYRIVAQPATATRIYYLAYASNDHMEMLPGGKTMYWTQGTTGAWTETTTRRAAIGPILSGITELSAPTLTDPPA